MQLPGLLRNNPWPRTRKRKRKTAFRYWRFVVGILLLNLLSVPASTQTPPKVFDLATYKRFIDHELSRVRPSCAMSEMGIAGRTVAGKLVDHLGNPLPDVIVALVEPIGHSGDCYYENFDLTDEKGEFAVEGTVAKNRLIFRRPDGRIWRESVKIGDVQKRFEWPTPSTLTVTIPDDWKREFNLDWANAEKAPVLLRLQTARYWSGLSIHHQMTNVDANGQAVFQDVVPGDYFLTLPKSIDLAGESLRRSVEVGRITVDEGADLQLTLQPEGSTRLVGSCPMKTNAPADRATSYVIAQRIRQHYEDQPPASDVVPIVEGRFETRALSPGVYRLRAFVKAVPQVQGRFGGAEPQVGSWLVEIQPNQDATRIDLDEQAPSKFDSAMDYALDAAIQRHGSLTAKQQALHWGEDVVAREFVRRLRSENIPYEWRRTLPELIRTISEQDEVTDELIDLMQTTRRNRQRRNLMDALRKSTYRAEDIATFLSRHLDSEDHLTRSTAARALGELAVHNPNHAGMIARKLEPLLLDPWEFIRISVAAYLGRIGSTNSVPALMRARSDSHPPVAMYAASSIWKIVGDPDDALPVMTETLGRDGICGLWEAAYLMQPIAEKHAIPPITQTKLRQVATLAAEPPFKTDFEYERSRAGKAAKRTLAIIESKQKLAPGD